MVTAITLIDRNIFPFLFYKMLHGIAKTIKQEHFLSSADVLYKSDNIDQTTPNHYKRGKQARHEAAGCKVCVFIVPQMRFGAPYEGAESQRYKITPALC